MISDWQNWFSNGWLSHWIAQVFLIVLATGLLDFFQRSLLSRLARKADKTPNQWDDAMLYAVRAPLGLLLWVIGLTIAAGRVPIESTGLVFNAGLLADIREVGLVVAITWFAWRVVGGVESNVLTLSQHGDTTVDEITVQGLGRLARIAVAITGGLVTLEAIGVSISGLLAAGGIGGIALGLAAKDMLANFFGGLTIFMDRPFKVGDWIKSPDRSIEGVVEQIGWRQSVVRTFDKRPLYIPNSVFSNIAVENPSRMTHRRIFETIGVRYDDFAQVGDILAAVEDLLRSSADIDQDQTLMVNFNAYGASSLDFFVYCFTHTVNWQEYHRVKQRILLGIGDIIADHGAEIAYPTRTLKVDSLPGLASGPEGEQDQSLSPADPSVRPPEKG